MVTVEFFFDYGSAFSYLADTQLPALAARTGASIVYRPMLLGAVLKATGNASPAAVPAKGRYMLTELERWSRRYGVPARPNPFFPVNTLRLMRGAVATLENATFERWHDAIFPAFWAEARDLGSDEVVRAVVERAGLDADDLLARLEQRAVKDALRAITEDAIARGVFGAPTFFVGDEMFWGNDRLSFVEDAIHKAIAVERWNRAVAVNA